MSFPVSKSNLKQLQKPRSSKELKGIKPQLTSLVDVMTILLIYILQSFSTEGEIFTQAKNLILPESSAKNKPNPTVVIAVTNEHLMAEGAILTSIDKILSNNEMLIPELSRWLEQRRTMTEKIEHYSTKTKFQGDVTIQADKRIRFRLLKKIMFTCGQQAFNNFFLAVQQRNE